MTHDKQTLMSAVHDLHHKQKTNPDCFSNHDLQDLGTLVRSANWLLGEASRGEMSEPRHGQIIRKTHALREKLEKKWQDYQREQKWRQDYLREQEEKFNPNHKPAGSPDGGQFDSAEGGGSGSGTKPSRTSPLKDGTERGPSSAPAADKPRTAKKPLLPEYRNGVKPVSDKDWNTIHDILDKRPKASEVKKHAYNRIWAAEDGLKHDPKNGATAGIMKDTLKNVKKDPALAAKLKNIKTPSDLKNYPELVPDIYDAHFDENLKDIGGSAGLEKVGNKYAATAMADTVFREGRGTGGSILRRAIVATDPEMEKMIDSKNPLIISSVFPAYSQLAKDPAILGTLLDNVAKERIRQRPEETARPDYFRFEEDRAKN